MNNMMNKIENMIIKMVFLFVFSIWFLKIVELLILSLLYYFLKKVNLRLIF